MMLGPMEHCVGVLANCISSAFGFFGRIFDSIPGSVAVYFASIVVVLAVRFFLLPVVGAGVRSGASDKVRKAKNGRGK